MYSSYRLYQCERSNTLHVVDLTPKEIDSHPRLIMRTKLENMSGTAIVLRDHQWDTHLLRRQSRVVRNVPLYLAAANRLAVADNVGTARDGDEVTKPLASKCGQRARPKQLESLYLID